MCLKVVFTDSKCSGDFNCPIADIQLEHSVGVLSNLRSLESKGLA